MTRSQCKELLPTLQRWCAGETLQVGPKNWEDVDEDEHIAFVFPSNYYRIKPNPRVVWVTFCDNRPGCAYSEKEHERTEDKSNRRKFIEVIE